MSYQVLARKWRPKTFQDMVGQEHVLKALIHALESQRLHHAYLFTGTRGVGKTTIGRLLAQCLNCETGITPTPCGECSSCREIQEGRFVDLMEIDAASRTGVDDMRELTDNVQYTPARGRFKVYLIDEVHMLTTQSFNAFLKTLEEPPEHVKFLLATTDPQKLPITVLSRCLQFNLKRMTPGLIANHLNYVLTQEQIPFEEAALWLLARAADGSMRDALSLTDQAIAFGNQQLASSDVSSMLGTIDQNDIARLVDTLVANDGPGLLVEIRRIADFAPDYTIILADLLSLFHRVTMEQVVPDSVDNALGDAEQIQALARQLSAEDAQLFYQAALIGRKDLAITPDARMGFEMTLLRMLAFRPGASRRQPTTLASSPAAASEPSEEPDRVHNSVAGSTAEAAPAPEPYYQKPEPQDPEYPEPETEADLDVPAYLAKEQSPPPWNEGGDEEDNDEPEAPPVAAEAEPEVEAPVTDAGFDWPGDFRSLGIVGMPGNLASQGAMRREGDVWVLTLDDGHVRLLTDRHQRRIGEALKQRFGDSATLRVETGDAEGLTPAVWEEQQRQARQASAEQAIHNDPLVDEIVERFGGRVVEESIRPVDAL